MKTHVEFEVTKNPSLIEKVADIMSHCDLGVEQVLMPQKLIYSWDTTSLVDKKYISKMKRALKKGIEADGDRVLSIKNIKIEVKNN